MQYSHDEMVNKIVMWRDALEKGYNINTVFESMCVYLGEQQREISKLRNTINESEQKEGGLQRGY